MATASISTRSIQGEALSAANDRLVNTALLREGVINFAGDSYKVAQDTGSNMQVKIGSGTAFDRAVVEGDNAGQGAFICEHANATQTLAVAAADPTNDRIDIVVLRVYDDTFDSSGLDEADIEVIQGTPAGSPVAPATPNSALKLAEILVGAAVTAITDANITDFRVEAEGSRTPQGLVVSGSTVPDVDSQSVGWEDWGAALDLGDPGRNVKIAAYVSGSALVDAGLERSAQIRVAISLDGGSTFTTGNESWIDTDDVAAGIRRGSAAAQHVREGVPTGTVVVQLQRNQPTGTAGEVNFNEGFVQATMVPAD